jgi:hypothetical protein
VVRGRADRRPVFDRPPLPQLGVAEQYDDPMAGPARRSIRRVAVGAAGLTTVATGIVLMPLPGPGTLIVLGGLAILRREFPAAGVLLDRIRGRRPQVAAGRTPTEPPAPHSSETRTPRRAPSS